MAKKNVLHERTQKEIRRNRVMELAIAGFPDHVIADMMKSEGFQTSTATVQRDRTGVVSEMARRNEPAVEVYRALQTSRYEALFQKWWAHLCTGDNPSSQATDKLLNIMDRINTLNGLAVPRERILQNTGTVGVTESHTVTTMTNGNTNVLVDTREKTATMLEEINEKHREAGLGHYRLRPALDETESEFDEYYNALEEGV